MLTCLDSLLGSTLLWMKMVFLRVFAIPRHCNVDSCARVCLRLKMLLHLDSLHLLKSKPKCLHMQTPLLKPRWKRNQHKCILRQFTKICGKVMRMRIALLMCTIMHLTKPFFASVNVQPSTKMCVEDEDQVQGHEGYDTGERYECQNYKEYSED